MANDLTNNNAAQGSNPGSEPEVKFRSYLNRITVVDGHKVAVPIKSVEEFIRYRNDAKQILNLRKAREEGDKEAKSKLLQINGNAVYEEKGLVKGNRYIGPFFGIDIDNPEDFSRAVTLLYDSKSHELTTLGQALGTQYIQTSVRQGGHFIFRRETGKTILENQVRIAMILKCEMDTNAHDVNRVLFCTSASPLDLIFINDEIFYSPYDMDAIMAETEELENRVRNGLEEVPPGAHKTNKHYKPWEEYNEMMMPAGSLTRTVVDEPQDAAIEELCFNQIPYRAIIDKYWELFNNGLPPVQGSRNTEVYQLAYCLRTITDYDVKLLCRIIPNYGLPESEKEQSIRSAVSQRRTQMPKRMHQVLEALTRDYVANDDLTSTNVVEELLQSDSYYFYNSIGHLPQGYHETIEGIGPSLALPGVVVSSCIVGALATGVELDVHGKVRNLNLIGFVVGDYASGKGNLDEAVDAWLKEIYEQDAIYHQQEQAYREQKLAAKNKKEQPKEPKLPVRIVTLNNTIANIAERLGNTQGQHAISYTCEADTVAQKLRSSISDYSVMLRQAFDGSRYEREARSLDSVRVFIPKILWNVIMVGTPDSLFRVVGNCTDGFQSRIAIAKTPDNTFAPLSDNMYNITDAQAERIRQVAHLLQLMKGKVVLAKLEAKGRAWVEAVRLDSMKNDDCVLARQRFRVTVTAQRMVCCIMLCAVCQKLIKQYGPAGAEEQLKQNPDLWKDMLLKTQTTAMLAKFDVIADALIENSLYFFRNRIEQAFNSPDYIPMSMNGIRKKGGKNDSIYARLPEVFTFEQAMDQAIAVKGAMKANQGTVAQMLKNWKNQQLITMEPNKRYRKIQNS